MSLRRYAAALLVSALATVPDARAQSAAHSGPPQPLVAAAVTSVDVQLKVPGAANAGGIHVWLSGGQGLPGLNEEARTDTEGHATILSRRTGFSYVFARRKDCDLTIGGTAKNLAIAGGNQATQRGRLDLSSLGGAAHPDFFFNQTAAEQQDEQPGPLAMRVKTPGKARFMFCVEDSELLRLTMRPENQPMPSGKVYVTGDWNNFNTRTEDVDEQNGAKEMFDDGGLMKASGDDKIGDGVYTRVLDLSPGEHTYAFLVNGMSSFHYLFKVDPYAEGTREVTIKRPWAASPTSAAEGESEATFPASVITVTAPR